MEKENPQFNPEDFKKASPTDSEFIAMIDNSRLPVLFQRELKDQMNSDPWIKRQLAKIYWEIDKAHDNRSHSLAVANMLWEALRDDWKVRRTLPDPEKKKYSS